MTNQITVIEQSNAPAVSTPQPCVRDIVSPSGKVTGTRYTFGGSMTPSELKAHLKARGMTKGINKAVREVQRGKRTQAWAEMQCVLEVVRSKGHVPSVSDVRANGSCVKFVKVEEAVAKVKKAKEPVDPEQVIAARMGIAVDELRQMYANA